MVGKFCNVCCGGCRAGKIETRSEPSEFNPAGNPIGVHLGKCHARYANSALKYWRKSLKASGRDGADYLPYGHRI